MSGTEGGPADIQREVEAQREQLADTVDQLTAKLDVKAQAQHQAARVKDAATTPDGKPRPEVLAAAGATLALVVGVVVLVVRRRRS